VHTVAKDVQQVDDGGSAAASAVVRKVPNSNGGYLKYRIKPTVGVTSVTHNTANNNTTVNYTASDTGDGGMTSVDVTVTDVSTGASVHTESNTVSNYPSSLSYSFSIPGSKLTQSHEYEFEVKATDRDSNTGSGKLKSTTRDITKPVISATSVTSLANGGVTVGYTLSETGVSGLSAAKIHLRTDASALDEATLLVLNPARNNLEKSVTVGSSTVTFAQADLQEWTKYYAFAGAKDVQGWYNTSGDTFGSKSNVTGTGIGDNEGRTRDIIAPALNANPVMTKNSDGASVKIACTGATDGGSGIATVKALVTTDSGAKTVWGATNSGDTVRTASKTGTAATATGNVNVTGLTATTRVYGWLVSRDGQGNLSDQRRTNPQSMILDSGAPVLTFVSGLQADAGLIKVTVKCEDASSVDSSGSRIYLREKGKTAKLQ
jgi:hypothetical protein